MAPVRRTASSTSRSAISSEAHGLTPRASTDSLAGAKLRWPLIWGGLALLATAPATPGEVLMTEKAAIERAFPESTAERLTLYLTKEQTTAVEQAAHSRLPSAIVTAFIARRDGAVTGRAVLDTHTVRTKIGRAHV